MSSETTTYSIRVQKYARRQLRLGRTHWAGPILGADSYVTKPKRGVWLTRLEAMRNIMDSAIEEVVENEEAAP